MFTLLRKTGILARYGQHLIIRSPQATFSCSKKFVLQSPDEKYFTEETPSAQSAEESLSAQSDEETLTAQYAYDLKFATDSKQNVKSVSEFISSSGDLKQLLKVCQKIDKFNRFYIKIVVEKLRSFKDDDKLSEKEPQIRRVLNAFDNDFNQLTDKLACTVFSHLLDIFEHDPPQIEAVGHRCFSTFSRLPPMVLVEYIKTLDQHQETELRQNLLKHVLSVSEKRMSDFVLPFNVLFFLQRPNTSANLRKLAEDQALVLTPVMDFNLLYVLLINLANSKSRNPKLIHSIVYHMNQLGLELNIKQIQVLLFALCSLKICDIQLLENISKLLMERLSQDKLFAKVAGNITTSLGILRYYHQELFDTLIDFFKTNLDANPKFLASIVISSGWVNLSLSESKLEDLKRISAKCETLKESNPSLWLDLVWSEVVLGIESKEHVQSVLDEGFIKSVTESVSSYKALINQQKISNIQTFCSSSDQEFKIPTKATTRITTSVIKALGNFVPGAKYLRENVSGRGGCHVDAEFIVDKNGAPQPLADYPSLLSYNPSPLQIPDNLHWVALRVHDFPDLTLRSIRPTGVNVLSTRILKRLGYKVVEIPHRVFVTKETTLQQVQYLQEKIKEAISQS